MADKITTPCGMENTNKQVQISVRLKCYGNWFEDRLGLAICCIYRMVAIYELFIPTCRNLTVVASHKGDGNYTTICHLNQFLLFSIQLTCI